MIVFSRRRLLWVLLGAVCFSPVVVGAVPAFWYALASGAVLIFAAYAFGPARPLRLKRAALVMLSGCLAVTLCDLCLRPLYFHLFEVRPTERFLSAWPPLPLLHRYAADVSSEWDTYGDLAGASGRKDWREMRRVEFVTDAHGFRNEPRGAGAEARPLDVIVLGDSFGVAGGTTQADTVSGVLARDYGLNTYNLSVSRENPGQQYANLVIEGRRLKTRAGTCVLWLVFTGNDLDEPYHPELADPRPAPPGWRTRLVTGFKDFRERSPVRRLLRPGSAGLVIERPFVDGRHMLFYGPYAERRGRTAEEVRRHPNFESLKATLGAMRRLAGERGLTVMVALVPSKEEVYAWALDGAPPWSADTGPSGFSVVMRELSAQQEFRFLDLKPPLAEASGRAFAETGALLWWRDDTHWNAAGQRAVAAAVIRESFIGGAGGQARAESQGRRSSSR